MLQKFWQRVTGSAGAPAVPPAGPPRPAPVAPLDLTDADFADRILLQADSSLLVVVDFWAEWCAPCDLMSLHVARLAQMYGDRLLVAALDVDENPATAEQYQVMGLPTLLFFQGGVEVGRQVGLIAYEALTQKVDALLTTHTNNVTNDLIRSELSCE
jgi:thioredoxin 1